MQGRNDLTRGFLRSPLFSFWRFRHQTDAIVDKFFAISSEGDKCSLSRSELQNMNKLEKHIKNNHNTNLYSLQRVLNLNMGIKETIFFKDKLTNRTI